jgi:hypothetical protein
MRQRQRTLINKFLRESLTAASLAALVQDTVPAAARILRIRVQQQISQAGNTSMTAERFVMAAEPGIPHRMTGNLADTTADNRVLDLMAGNMVSGSTADSMASAADYSYVKSR